MKWNGHVFGPCLMFTPKAINIPRGLEARAPLWLAICRLLDLTDYQKKMILGSWANEPYINRQ